MISYSRIFIPGTDTKSVEIGVVDFVLDFVTVLCFLRVTYYLS